MKAEPMDLAELCGRAIMNQSAERVSTVISTKTEED